MCQLKGYRHLCNHITFGPKKTCTFHLFHHGANKTIEPNATLCSLCRPKPVITPIVPVVQIQTVPVTPLVFVPQTTYVIPQPQPLPVPAGTPTYTKREFIGGRWQDVVHYGTPKPSAGPGQNPIHGNDSGALPPGWGEATKPVATKGINPIHGIDPGAPPPGGKYIPSKPHVQNLT